VRVVVFGAGAIGSLLAAYLDRAGHSVLIIARAAHVAAVREGGLRMEGEVEGVVHVEAAEELPPGPVPDVVLLTVKTFDLTTAARAVGRGVRPGTPVLLPQNGLGVEAIADAAFRGAGWEDPGPSLVRAVNSGSPGRARSSSRRVGAGGRPRPSGSTVSCARRGSRYGGSRTSPGSCGGRSW
jgi:ketopantoate reductase